MTVAPCTVPDPQRESGLRRGKQTLDLDVPSLKPSGLGSLILPPGRASLPGRNSAQESIREQGCRRMVSLQVCRWSIPRPRRTKKSSLSPGAAMPSNPDDIPPLLIAKRNKAGGLTQGYFTAEKEKGFCSTFTHTHECLPK